MLLPIIWRQRNGTEVRREPPKGNGKTPTGVSCAPSACFSTWSRDGFWTPENIRAYEMIYQYYDEGAPVSAI